MGNVVRLQSEQQHEDGLPDWVNRELWADWRAHRRELKRAMTATGERRLLSRLERAIKAAMGLGWEAHEAEEEIVTRSIECGWVGLFPLKEGPRGETGNGECRVTMSKLQGMTDSEVIALAQQLGVATRGKRKSELFPQLIEAAKRAR